MNAWTKAYIKTIGLSAAASAALFGVYYGLDAFESKITDKKNLERELKETKERLEKTQDRLEDSDRLVRRSEIEANTLRFTISRLNAEKQAQTEKSEANGPEGFRT